MAQTRKRIFIIGTKNRALPLHALPEKQVALRDILETNQASLNTKLTRLLLSHFKLEDLHGKAIKDKRGGKENIHSWDIGLKGDVSESQKELLNLILLYRCNKKWTVAKGIQWMDGMPLTTAEIQTLLDDLVQKNYLKYEHPKDIAIITENGSSKKVGVSRQDVEKVAKPFSQNQPYHQLENILLG